MAGSFRSAASEPGDDDAGLRMQRRMKSRVTAGEEARIASARRREAGMDAERIAGAFLERQGMEVVARNYRCRLGEIDIVAREGETLVFVEVRLRSRGRFGGAAESIDTPKQRRLVAAARHYLMRSGSERATRFDAVLLDGLDESRIDWRRGVIGA